MDSFSKVNIQDLEYDETVILKFMNFIDLGKEQMNVICEEKKQHDKGKVISGLVNVQDESLHLILIRFVILKMQLTRPIPSSYL